MKQTRSHLTLGTLRKLQLSIFQNYMKNRKITIYILYILAHSHNQYINQHLFYLFKYHIRKTEIFH
jgi:hypothetical protein